MRAVAHLSRQTPNHAAQTAHSIDRPNDLSPEQFLALLYPLKIRIWRSRSAGRLTQNESEVLDLFLADSIGRGRMESDLRAGEIANLTAIRVNHVYRCRRNLEEKGCIFFSQRSQLVFFNAGEWFVRAESVRRETRTKLHNLARKTIGDDDQREFLPHEYDLNPRLALEQLLGFLEKISACHALIARSPVSAPTALVGAFHAPTNTRSAPTCTSGALMREPDLGEKRTPRKRDTGGIESEGQSDPFPLTSATVAANPLENKGNVDQSLIRITCSNCGSTHQKWSRDIVCSFNKWVCQDCAAGWAEQDALRNVNITSLSKDVSYVEVRSKSGRRTIAAPSNLSPDAISALAYMAEFLAPREFIPKSKEFNGWMKLLRENPSVMLQRVSSVYTDQYLPNPKYSNNWAKILHQALKK